jgi:hypothetical protein
MAYFLVCLKSDVDTHATASNGRIREKTLRIILYDQSVTNKRRGDRREKNQFWKTWK